jgi:hypothetical protein
MILSGTAGAALMYFLDPDRGRRRRNMARDRVAATFRGGFRRMTRAGRAAGAEAYGLSQRVTHLTPKDPFPPNDATLAKKVESEVFRDADAPKGAVDVSVVNGVVELRGQVTDAAQSEALELKTRMVTGVRDVRNLLHLPGQLPANMGSST